MRNVAVDDPRVTTKPIDVAPTTEPHPESETEPQESPALTQSTPEVTTEAPEIEKSVDVGHVTASSEALM